MNNKKKMLLVVLLLLAIVGFGTYGAYSYYYTQSSVTTVRAENEDSDNVIRITGSFYPALSISGGSSGSGSSGSDFLGNGGTIYLDCPEKSGSNETITCTSSVTVYNQGSTGIYVSSYDRSVSASSDDADVEVISSSFDWDYSGSGDTNTYISSGSSSTFYISVDVKVGNSTSVSYDEPQLVTDPVLGGSLTVYASFNLEASQNHNY